jgi:hypothetical protein
VVPRDKKLDTVPPVLWTVVGFLVSLILGLLLWWR